MMTEEEKKKMIEGFKKPEKKKDERAFDEDAIREIAKKILERIRDEESKM